MAVKLSVQQFGRYRLVDRLATGGVAEIWRARTVGAAGFERLVAIKKILPQLGAQRDFVERLISEATQAAQLSHANIVQTFDFDQVGGVYYLAMELVEGKDLRQILRRGKEIGKGLSVPQAANIACELLKALTYAHERPFPGRAPGFLHRDLSPHNILISYHGEVKLTSFGTGDGVLLGRAVPPAQLAYRAPEQIDGRPLDGRADLFGLGAVFYEMLTGERAFSGKEEAEITQRVKEHAPPPPSQKDPKIPKELDAFVQKLLEKDPQKRFPSTRAAQQELADFLHAYVEDFSAVDLSSYVNELFYDDSARESGPLETEKLPGKDEPASEVRTAPPSAETGPLPRVAEPRPSRSGLWLGLGAGLLAALGAGGYFLFWS